MNKERTSLDNTENASAASLPDNDVESMPKIDHTLVTKVTRDGLSYYDAPSIQHVVHDLKEKYGEGYTKVDRPLNANMQREHQKSQDESPEERARKRVQAETSRFSRDRTKFIRSRFVGDNAVLESMLQAHINRLVNLEHYANEVLVKSGQPPIKWQNVWIDDACPDSRNSVENEDNSTVEAGDKAMNVTMDEPPSQFDDHCSVNSNETFSDNDNVTMYEIDEDGGHSGQEDA